MPTLIPSSQETVDLVTAVLERLMTVEERTMRIRGTKLIAPPSMATDFLRMRDVRRRYEMCDFRHTEDQERAVKNIALWLLDVNTQLSRYEAQVKTGDANNGPKTYRYQWG